MRLKRTDIAPPGGFNVTAPTGQTISGESFQWVKRQLTTHLQGNGFDDITTGEIEEMIHKDTCERLEFDKHHKWIEKKPYGRH